MENAQRKRGWFKIPGIQDGDRTIDQQLEGLDDLFDVVPGKTILDLGTAEGLLCRELSLAGARRVHGIEIRQDFVDVAIRQCKGLPCIFTCADLNIFRPQYEQSDIVLMLAICHKVRDPSAFATYFGNLARWLVVVRLPPKTAPVVIDDRSGRKPHDIQSAIENAGLKLRKVAHGTFGEWTGYFYRG